MNGKCCDGVQIGVMFKIVMNMYINIFGITINFGSQVCVYLFQESGNSFSDYSQTFCFVH